VHETIFVVKVSKFCNLRCHYCYEHRELHVRDAMSKETLGRLLAGADAFGDELVARGISPKFSFVWHGGEPLLLPPSWYEAIIEQQQHYIRRFAYRNSVQTNLFGINAATLKLVIAAGWELGVSIDFAERIRINAGGRDSNGAVIAAAEALSKSGARFGAISVLGAHNRDTLVDAYDWVSEFAQGWRILPVFGGGPEDSLSRLRLREEEVVRVFLELFERRAGAKRYIPIAPLDDYVKWATLKIAGRRLAGGVLREMLDNIFVVNVNGDVFTRPFAYDGQFCLGNINGSSMPEMVGSETYRSCRQQILARKLRNCVGCESFGFCDTSPMHEHGAVTDDAEGGRCVRTRSAIREIESELSAAGIDQTVIESWVRQGLAILPLPQPDPRVRGEA
jgi:uncharacterized protein